MLAIGIKGWMADFGEALPHDAVLYESNIAASTLHNRFPVLWAQLNRDACQHAEATGVIPSADEIVYFSRSGAGQSPGAARLFWLGDQLPDWDSHDGLSSAVKGLISSGFSGYSLSHSDIGGYLFKSYLHHIYVYT